MKQRLLKQLMSIGFVLIMHCTFAACSSDYKGVVVTDEGCLPQPFELLLTDYRRYCNA